MAFTPICPDCGSAAVTARSSTVRECKRCGFSGGNAAFTRRVDRIERGGFDARSAGFAFGDRTIRLSDEWGD